MFTHLHLHTQYSLLEGAIRIKDLVNSKTKIIAPFKGIIDEIKGKKGQILTPYVSPILRIINLNNMYVEALVPENHLPNIKIGSEAIVKIPVLNSSQKT